MVEPTGYIATIPGPDGSRICVGPFENRLAAFDFCTAFMDAVSVGDDGVAVGPTYSPVSMLALVADANDDWKEQHGNS